MKLTFNAEQFKPVDHNILVQPGPVKKINTVDYKVNSGVDVKGKDGVKDPVKTYERQPTKTRVGKILAVPENSKELPYNVGDWVVYKDNNYNMQKLDLLAKKSDDDRCPIIMKHFEIIAKVNIEE